MKTLIINGSPRINGDTSFLISELKKYLNGEIVEISAYRNNISPCIDCRHCREENNCFIKDDMQIIYEENYDNIVIASPVYISGLPGPLINIANRFQVYSSAVRFLNKKIEPSSKNGVLILVGGGSGHSTHAINIIKSLFKKLGISNENIFEVMSLNTDNIPVSLDLDAIKKIKDIAVELSK